MGACGGDPDSKGGGESDRQKMEAVNFRRLRLALCGVTIALVLVAPYLLYPCGPVFYSPIFISSQQPENADAYVSGRLGVPLRSYRDVYAYVAYRYLSGQPLTETEQQLVLTPPANISSWPGEASDDDRLKPWFDARAKVPGVPPGPTISMFKDAGSYQSFVNCTPDAFQMAAKTLTDRMTKYGAASPEVKDWVAGQDRVFVQCSANTPGVAPFPDEVSGAAPTWLKEDRAYQIAAANFYAGNFDQAHAQFLAIGADGSSPWQVWGKYLAGRSLVRKASLHPAPDKAFDPQVMAQAETELKQVLADPKLQAVHEAARQVLGYVEFRLHPVEREKELAAVLAKPHAAEGFQQDLKDYLLLIRDNDDPDEEMGRWMSAFRAYAVVVPDAKEAAPESKVSPIEEWSNRNTLPWLVLAMSTAKPGDANVSKLMAAAEKVGAESPAYPTLVYGRARLSSAEQARKILDGFLSTQGNKVSLSTKNLFLRKRLEVASDFSDFLAHAERRPAAAGADGYGDEFIEYCGADDKNADCKRAYLDSKAASDMDLMPISDWLHAADDKSFDMALRKDLALATWCRAVLLEDWTAADQAAALVKQEMPETAKYIDPYLEAKDPAEKKFAAVFTMLHWPGIRPSLADQTLRDTPLNELDNFRQNWWCSFVRMAAIDNIKFEPGHSGGVSATATPVPVVNEPSFLSAQEQEKAREENRKLAPTEYAPNYLEPVVLAWAKAHPDDPRVPEALHLAVTAGHLSCSTDETAKYSKEAFTLLHAKYPESAWAKKTKYWYK